MYVKDYYKGNADNRLTYKDNQLSFIGLFTL